MKFVVALLLVAQASACLGAGSGGQAAAPAAGASAAPAAGPREKFLSAVALAKAGKHAEAIPLLDEVLATHPRATKARFVRAKMRFRLAQFDTALEDVEQVLKEMPAFPGGPELLAEIRKNVKPVTVTVVGGKTKYSEWIWSWTIHGDKAFALADFKGAESHTLFYWPKSGETAELEKLEAEASEQNLYFLRVVKAELAEPGAKDHGVKAVPFMVLMDEQGAEVARGTPTEVQPKFDAMRKARRDAKQPLDPITNLDLSKDVKAPEDMGRTGFTTVVMLTSPG